MEKPLRNAYPFWALRFWDGMVLSVWLRFVLPRCGRIHPLRVPMAVIVTFVATINSVLHFVQQLFYGRALAATRIEEPPIFIIGHWRSGTTLLHELLVLDDRFAFPTTYECFAPNHFLISSWLLPKLIGILLPAKRPMDDMSVSFDHPQEDEFALMSLGAPSPMLRLGFPNDPPPYMELLEMEGVAEEDLRRWKEVIVTFVRTQTYAKRKPLVLKSPPHTGRIGVLAELFPEARFIHIVRDPFSLFASTRRLWCALDEIQGFQRPTHEHLDDFVWAAFERMYQGFERQRPAIDESRICDVRYEDLVKDPVGEVAQIYDKLNLGHFERVRDKIRAYMKEKKEYQPNRHQLEPEIRDAICRRWAAYMEKYGYAQEAVKVG